MKKIYKYLLTTTLLFFVYSNISFAEVAPSTLVQNFIQAIESKNKDKITLAFNELITNIDAQKLLKDKWPNHFTLFNFYKIAQKINDLKSTYGFEPTSTVDNTTITPNTTKGLSSNRDYINLKNTPNRIAVRQSSPLSNIEAVRQSPNQNQISNQENIRRRR